MSLDVSAVTDRNECVHLDAADPLAPLRDLFHLPEGLLYLDGNSLGPLPRGVPGRVARMLEREWGESLIAGWMKHGWMEAPLRAGELVAPLIGAAPGQVLVCDTVGVNLHKLLLGALAMAVPRRVVLTEEENFHTDVYVASGIVEALDGRAELRIVPRSRFRDELNSDVAVALVTHVDYRTGEMHDMESLTRAVHDAGALMLWDLSHSVGAVPVELDAAGADLAVGCGYKYLNAGPGAPAFLYVAQRHQERFRSPLRGWLGHANPFAFDLTYEPAEGIRRNLVSSPPIVATAVLESALEVFGRTSMEALREKSLALTDLFIALVERRCAGHGLRLVTPREPSRRGSQVSFAHDDAYGIVQALIERDVIGDFRVPNIARFGFAPLYVRFADVWDAVDRLAAVLESGAHRDARFTQRAAVT